MLYSANAISRAHEELAEKPTWTWRWQVFPSVHLVRVDRLDEPRDGRHRGGQPRVGGDRQRGAPPCCEQSEQHVAGAETIETQLNLGENQARWATLWIPGIFRVLLQMVDV